MFCKTFFLFCTLIELTRAASDSDLVDYDSLFGASPRKNKNFTELARFDGYNVETHTVTTKDGYILSVFHIPPKANCLDPEPIIFWHGLYLSSDDCIIPGPGKAHCYIYHANCYDMWAPNNRGNRYSRKHIQMDPEDPDFWDFAIDEMAEYDLPVVIDFVLEKTGKKQLSFVGHSQSVALLILLCAARPEYNAKIRYGFGMSTTTWLDYSTFFIIEIQGILEPILTTANNAGVNAEIFPHGGLTNTASRLLCGSSKLEYPFCASAIFATFGYDKGQITPDVMPVVASSFPAGTSLKNFNRWGQIKNNGFSKYDFGAIGNLDEYGDSDPPVFNLKNVTMKWVFLGSESDNIGDLKDLQTLISNLKNTESSKCILTEKLFNNLAFVYGKDVPKLTSIVMSFLRTGKYAGPYANCSATTNYLNK